MGMSKAELRALAERACQQHRVVKVPEGERPTMRQLQATGAERFHGFVRKVSRTEVSEVWGAR